MYIYTISCPESKNIVYIGKTECFTARSHAHLSVKIAKSNIEKWCSIILKAGNKPIIEILDIVDDSESSYWEGFYVRLMQSWGFDLLNMKSTGVVRNYKNHTQLAYINNLGLTFKQFCEMFFLDYKLLHYAITMTGNFTYSQSLIIDNIIKYAKNNPTVRAIKRDKRAKRKEQKKITDNRV